MEIWITTCQGIFTDDIYAQAWENEDKAIEHILNADKKLFKKFGISSAYVSEYFADYNAWKF